MQDETGMHANSLPYKRHYENHNVSWEDNQDSMLSRERMYRQKDPRFRHGFGAPWEEYKYPDINTGRETYRPRNRPPYQEFRPRDWEQQFQQIPQQFHILALFCQFNTTQAYKRKLTIPTNMTEK